MRPLKKLLKVIYVGCMTTGLMIHLVFVLLFLQAYLGAITWLLAEAETLSYTALGAVCLLLIGCSMAQLPAT
jgi:hypothetical protein